MNHNSKPFLFVFFPSLDKEKSWPLLCKSPLRTWREDTWNQFFRSGVMSVEHPHSTPPAFRLCEPNSAKFLRKGKLHSNNFIQITIFCWKISLKTLKASSVRVVVRLTQLLAVRTMHLSRAPSRCIAWQTASFVYWDWSTLQKVGYQGAKTFPIIQRLHLSHLQYPNYEC